MGRPKSPVSSDLLLFEAAREVFARVYVRRVRVRSLVVAARQLAPAPVQYELFAGQDEIAAERKRNLYAALDRLRGAHPGRAAPAFGRALAAVSKDRERVAAPGRGGAPSHAPGARSATPRGSDAAPPPRPPRAITLVPSSLDVKH
jgi:hypothetical protein